MKKYNYYLGTICIILGLLPLILLRDLTIINENFTQIISSLGGLMTASILLVLFGADERCLSIRTKNPGLSETQTDWFTVPLLCIIFLVEIVIFYLIYPSFVKEHFTMFLSTIGSIVATFVLYALLGGTYALVRTKEVKETKDKKK